MPQEAPSHSNSHSDAAAASAPASTNVRGPGSGDGKRLAIGIGFDRLAKISVWLMYRSAVSPCFIEAWTGETEATLRQWTALYQNSGLAGLAEIDMDNPMPGGFDPLTFEQCRILAHWGNTEMPAGRLVEIGGNAEGN